MKLKAILRNFGLMLLAVSIETLLPMSAMAADDESITSSGIAPFAMVGNKLISLSHFNHVYIDSSKHKYYHGKPPELEIAKMQREVGDKLIVDILLVIEAKRRNIKPDEVTVSKALASYERDNANDPDWLRIRDVKLPQLTKQIEEEILAKQFEEMLLDVALPSDQQLRQYYADHPDLFTQPEQVRVSRILVAVAPGADQDTWETARVKLLSIVKQVEDGADFGEMAKQYSDAEGEEMGDIGYLHGGMLAQAAQASIDSIKVGETTDVIVTIEGASILQLTARDPASLNSFENVKERATGLWQREEGEKTLETLIADLKAKTKIWVNEAHYLPLSDEDDE